MWCKIHEQRVVKNGNIGIAWERGTGIHFALNLQKMTGTSCPVKSP